jgi:hypothetical protein
MDQFDTVKMASGGLALVLEPSSTWGEFPAHVEKWKRRLGAMSLSKAVITFDECIAEVAVADGVFWITSAIAFVADGGTSKGIVRATKRTETRWDF